MKKAIIVSLAISVCLLFTHLVFINPENTDALKPQQNIRIIVYLSKSIIDETTIATLTKNLSSESIRNLLKQYNIKELKAVLRNRYDENGSLKFHSKTNERDSLTGWQAFNMDDSSKAAELIARLNVTLNSGCGDVTLPQRIIWVGSPSFSGTSVTGPTQLTPGLAAVYRISPAQGASSYHWTIPSGCYYNYCWHIVTGQGTSTLSVQAGAIGSGAIQCTASNTCGSDSRYIYVNVQDPQDPDPCDELTLTVSPNPSTGGDVVINIIYPPEPCDETLMSSSVATLSVIDNMGTPVYSNTNYDEQVQIPAWTFKKGIYHIIYTKNNRRFEKSIIIE